MRSTCERYQTVREIRLLRGEISEARERSELKVDEGH